MSGIVDVHCHLTHESFADDLGEVLARAHAAGVHAIVCVGETAADNRAVLALARHHPMVKAALGHYPEHLDEAMAEETEALLRAHRDEVVAVGEVGIDHWLAEETSVRERQHVLFLRFVRLAGELDLPLSVHSRSAGHHALRLLLDAGARKVCLHAFDGKARYAAEAAAAGYYLSVPPSVLRSPQKQKMVRAVPLDRLLLETDAPVLGPEKDSRNEPANAVLSAQAVADLKGVPLADVLAACAHNTLQLFGALDPSPRA